MARRRPSGAGRLSAPRQGRPSWRDYLDAAGGDLTFAEYLVEGRKRFLRGEAATVQEVREIYRRVAAQVRSDIEKAAPGTLHRRHLEVLADRLEVRARELRAGVLQATQQGIRIAVNHAIDAPRRIALDTLGGVFPKADVAALFADVGERATLALLARTGPDGLRLSDRIWRVGENYRQAIQQILEDAVLRGEDARTTARRLQEYLQPGVGTALKVEIRRRLKVPADVSMEALRLAVTEIQHAHHEASIAAFHALPSYKGSYWRLSNAHVVRDICNQYAEHDGTGFWPQGEEPPKPHPWCRCYLVPAVEPSEWFAERIRSWLEDPASQPDIERWYQENARRFLRRPVRSRPVTPAATQAVAAAGSATGGTTGRQEQVAQGLKAWTEVHTADTVTEEVLDAALDELIAETQERLLRPLFDEHKLEIKATLDAQGKELTVVVKVGNGFFTDSWVIDPARKADVERLIQELQTAPDNLRRWQILRQLSWLRVGDKQKLRNEWRITVTRTLSRLGDGFDDQVRKAILEDDELQNDALAFTKQANTDEVADEDKPRVEEALRRAEEWLRKLLRGPMSKVEAVTELRVGGIGRSYYSPRSRSIQIYSRWSEEIARGVHDMARVMVHEFGHHLDLGGNWSRASRRLTSRWVERRIKDDTTTWGIQPIEWGYEDQFFMDYVGRVYGDALGEEVLTMGLEMLYDRPGQAVLLDPDHMALVLGLVKGVGAP